MFRDGAAKPVWLTVRSVYPEGLDDGPPREAPVVVPETVEPVETDDPTDADADADADDLTDAEAAEEGGEPHAAMDSRVVPAIAVNATPSRPLCRDS
jgi:hypothetical protein